MMMIINPAEVMRTRPFAGCYGANKWSYLFTLVVRGRTMAVMEQTTISPFAGAYLAGDRIAKTSGIMSIPAPAGGAKVSIEDLAVKIFAASFAELAALGALSMHIEEKKVLFVKTHRLVLRRGAGSAPAGALARLLECSVDGESVKDAVRRWFGSDVGSPWAVVINAAAQEAHQCGLVAPAEAGLIKKIAGKLLTGAAQMAPVEEKRAEIEAIGAATVERWNAFQAQEPAVAAALLKEIGDGLKSRVEASDYNAPDF